MAAVALDSAARERVMQDAIDDAGAEHKAAGEAFVQAERNIHETRMPAHAAMAQVASTFEGIREAGEQLRTRGQTLVDSEVANRSLVNFRAVRKQLVRQARGIRPRLLRGLNEISVARMKLNDHITAGLELRQATHGIEDIRRAAIVKERRKQATLVTVKEYSRCLTAAAAVAAAPVLLTAVPAVASVAGVGAMTLKAAAVTGGGILFGGGGAEAGLRLENRRNGRNLDDKVEKCTRLLAYSDQQAAVAATLANLETVATLMQYNLSQGFAEDAIPTVDDDDDVDDDMVLELEKLAAHSWLVELELTGNQLQESTQEVKELVATWTG